MRLLQTFIIAFLVLPLCLIFESCSVEKPIEDQGERAKIINTLSAIKKMKYGEALPKLDSLLKTTAKVFGEKDSLVAKIYYRKGSFYFFNKRYKNAITWYEKTQEIQQVTYEPSHKDIAKMEHILGSCYYKIKDYKTAEQHFLKAIQHRRKYKDPKLFKSYNQLANVYEKKGEYTKAEDYYKLGLANVNPNSTQGASFHKNIGIVYKDQEIPKAALLHFDSCLMVYQKLAVEKYKPKIAECYNLIGTVKKDLGLYEEALNFFKNAEDIFIEKKDENSLKELYNNIGVCYLEMKNYDKAAAFLEKSLDLKQKYYLDKFNYNISSTYVNWGDLYVAKMKYPEALTYYQKAIACHLYPMINDDSLQKIELDTFDIIGSKHHLLQALNSKSKVLQKIAKQQQDKRLLEIALHTATTACNLIDKMRLDHLENASKLYWRARTRHIYENAIDLAYQLDNENLGFEFLEKSKAALLLGELKLKVAKSNIPVEITQQEIILKEEIQKLSYTLDDKENKIKNKPELIKKKEALQHLMSTIENKYPNYFRAKYNTKVVSIGDIQTKLLQNSAALVAYLLTKEFLYTILVEQDHVDFCRTRITTDFNTTVDSFLKLLSDKHALENKKHYQKLLEHGAELYQYLLAPLQTNAQQLILIPDGIINYIPFEVLNKNDNSEPFLWLLSEHDISYAYSATTLLQHGQKKHVGNEKILAVAPVKFPETNLQPLDWSKKEVDDITGIIAGKKMTNGQAHYDAFKSIAKDYSILHCSTHASTKESKGDYPFIAFYDRKMKLPEIYNLHLDADLVVLSACETAKGILKTGEGVMSLSRGFAWAGVPATVTSLWEVNEKATAEIMVLFYENLLKNYPKDVALKQAKLTYLKNNPETSPYFWAAFILVGNADAIPYLNAKKG